MPDRCASTCGASADTLSLSQVIGPVLTTRVPPRDKRIQYDAAQLPVLDRAKEYAASDVVTAAMKVFARDPRVMSIDADLATTSGLEAGVAAVDQRRALNVGVAEANMMGIGEAFAALGSNTWISTFCPFYDWKVLRRIAVGHQERHEAMAAEDGWLSEGHGLDLTMLATAANFETRTNGATHMGNDDSVTFDAVAHLKIVDVSCPQQMLALMKWVMAGNRGLLYVRVMRTPSAVLYDSGYQFEFGKGSIVHGAMTDAAYIVSSGRGVHEAIAAAKICATSGTGVAVVDMPSIDEELAAAIVCERQGGLPRRTEQRLHSAEPVEGSVPARGSDPSAPSVLSINTLDHDGKPQFIHSGTYEELIEAFGLTAQHIASAVMGALKARGSR